jgi:hypothetical protein
MSPAALIPLAAVGGYGLIGLLIVIILIIVIVRLL